MTSINNITYTTCQSFGSSNCHFTHHPIVNILTCEWNRNTLCAWNVSYEMNVTPSSCVNTCKHYHNWKSVYGTHNEWNFIHQTINFSASVNYDTFRCFCNALDQNKWNEHIPSIVLERILITLCSLHCHLDPICFRFFYPDLEIFVAAVYFPLIMKNFHVVPWPIVDENNQAVSNIVPLW